MDDFEKVPLYNRDLSWLSFNERILKEAGKSNVPLLERINFLAIFSSNLDEFYRVRMPVISALQKLRKKDGNLDTEKEEIVKSDVLQAARSTISKQLDLFGFTLEKQVIPLLEKGGVTLIYNREIPDYILDEASAYFYERLAAFLEITPLGQKDYFPNNNQLYFVVSARREEKDELLVVNIPSDEVSRFYTVEKGEKVYVLFIDDILRRFLPGLFPNHEIQGMYAVKVTRDADLDLDNEFEGSLAQKIEKQIKKRDFGLATRFLYQPDLPDSILEKIITQFNLRKSSAVAGGFYHNMKDFFSFPIQTKAWKYKPQPPVRMELKANSMRLLERIERGDIMIHTPYQGYQPILRFFNEAALHPEVEEIFISMYRVASDSKILHALISAVKNGKKVTVFVELKARFDEANNISWAKKLKAAGVNVLYSIPNLKVHAKIALITMRKDKKEKYLGLLSTGNLNEKTATLYADHILLTANQDILSELREVFRILQKRKKGLLQFTYKFKHLLVAQFNLVNRFESLIDREIELARAGEPASMTIKINNLEEKGMIQKLYQASQAGVKIELIVRSICRLIPGLPGLSENISVRRIVDRYLEHSRVFIFNNGGDSQLFLGSADWMNRNLYNRIEVCFPILDPQIKHDIEKIIEFQLQDDASAETIGPNMNSIEPSNPEGFRAQERTYEYCLDHIRYESTEQV